MLINFMTAFNASEIPATVNTYEKLVAWSSLILNQINPDITNIEGAGSPVKSAQFGIFKIEETSKTNLFSRMSLELEEDFAYYNGPLWERVKEFSVNSVPPELTA